MHYPEAVSQTRFLKQVFLEILQNSQENNCARVSFLPKLQFYQKRISGTGVSLEFRKISKNIFFTEHLRTTASMNHG